MGMLVNGVWQSGAAGGTDRKGRFVRIDSTFRDRVTADGSSGFPAVAGRYRLYVSLACPWAHRTSIFRVLKGLEAAIPVAVVDPHMGDDGWTFGDTPDAATGVRRLHELYTLAKPDYTGRVTVPVLWDTETGRIVNNESADIIRMLNADFAGLARSDTDYYPPDLRDAIDAINGTVYDRVNNGVYKAGFAKTQAAYEEAFDALFETLDALEARLGERRYLAGDRLTEADWRLFTTLVRFDAVYHGHFKCNRQRLVDYPNLWGFTRELHQVPGVAGTVDLDHIKRHYYGSHRNLNPSGIVPKGPAVDFGRPHGRQRLPSAA